MGWLLALVTLLEIVLLTTSCAHSLPPPPDHHRRTSRAPTRRPRQQLFPARKSMIAKAFLIMLPFGLRKQAGRAARGADLRPKLHTLAASSRGASTRPLASVISRGQRPLTVRRRLLFEVEEMVAHRYHRPRADV
jgi:hypothetical protein